MKDSVVAGAVTASLLVVAYYMLYGRNKQQQQPVGGSQVATAARRRRKAAAAAAALPSSSSSSSSHEHDSSSLSSSRSNIIDNAVRRDHELKLKQAFKFAHMKDFKGCIDSLTQLIHDHPDSFDGHLLRGKTSHSIRAFFESSAVYRQLYEDAEVLLERIATFDDDLRRAQELASTAKQRLLIDIELRQSGLNDKDIPLELLDELIETISEAMESGEKALATDDELLLERVALACRCIDIIAQQQQQLEQQILQEQEQQGDQSDNVNTAAAAGMDEEAMNAKLEQYRERITNDCNTIIKSSQRDEILADAYYYRALLLGNDSPDQLLCIGHSIQKDPDFVDALLLRGQIYFNRMQEPDRAMSDFDRVLKLDPNNADALYHKAMLMLGTGQAKEADVVPMLKKVLLIQPENFDAATMLCSALQDSGDVDGAVDVMEALIGHIGGKIPSATLVDMHYMLSEYLLSAQQFDQCVRTCESQISGIESTRQRLRQQEEQERLESMSMAFDTLRRFAQSVRDNMSKFPALDALFAGQKAPFMNKIEEKDLRAVVFKAEDEDETTGKTLSGFVDCVMYLFSAGSSRVSMIQHLDRFKELSLQDAAISKACRSAYFLSVLFTDFVLRGEENSAYIVDSNFVGTLHQLLEAERQQKGDFYDNVDSFLTQITILAESRRRQLYQMQAMQQLQQLQ